MQHDWSIWLSGFLLGILLYIIISNTETIKNIINRSKTKKKREKEMNNPDLLPIIMKQIERFIPQLEKSIQELENIEIRIQEQIKDIKEIIKELESIYE